MSEGSAATNAAVVVTAVLVIARVILVATYHDGYCTL
jgi:hypothetical protein